MAACAKKYKKPDKEHVGTRPRNLVLGKETYSERKHPQKGNLKETGVEELARRLMTVFTASGPAHVFVSNLTQDCSSATILL